MRALAKDIAIGACPHRPGTDCLFVGDVGDNCARLQTDGNPHSYACGGRYFLYAVPEPVVSADAPAEHAVREAEDVFAVELTYPDTGVYPNIPMDSEAIVVAADGSKAWLIEKRLMLEDRSDHPTPARIFETPGDLRAASSGDVLQMSLATTIANPDGIRITGADLHPNGVDLVVRTAYWGGTYAFAMDAPLHFASLKVRP